MFLHPPLSMWKPDPVGLAIDWPASEGVEPAPAVEDPNVVAAINEARRLNGVFAGSCVVALVLSAICVMGCEMIIKLGPKPDTFPVRGGRVVFTPPNPKLEIMEKCLDELRLALCGLLTFALLFPLFYATKRPYLLRIYHARWLGSVVAAPALGLAALGLARFCWKLPSYLTAHSEELILWLASF